MKIGYALNGFRRWPIELTIPVLSELGYDGVQIVGARPMVDPKDYTPELRSELRDMLKKYKIEAASISSTHAAGFKDLLNYDAIRCRYPEEGEPLWSSVSSVLRKVKLEHTKNCIDLAADLGAQTVLISAGEPGVRPDLAYKMIIDGWKAAAKYAAEKKIYLTSELNATGMINCPDEILEAIQEVNSPWLALNFDVLHILVNRLPIEDAVKKLGKLIKSVHFSDGLRGKHFHLVPGDGDIDLHKFIETLMSVGFDGYLFIEVYTEPFRPGEAAKRAIEYTRKLLKEVGAL